MSRKIFFITGTSSGIGKALAEELLKSKDHLVCGFARRNTIAHDRYIHKEVDFADLESVKTFVFPDIGEVDEVYLVNNAGVIGQIKRIGNLDAAEIIECYTVNTFAPAILTNAFIKSYPGKVRTVLNISSGAARFPIDAWSIYCSSKAAVDMFSKVLAEEVKITDENVRVVSVAPGVVDTFMQNRIRASDDNDFSRKGDFVGYKEKGELLSPEFVAKELCKKILFNPLMKEPVVALKEL